MHDDDDTFWALLFTLIMLLPTARQLSGEEPYNPLGFVLKVLACFYGVVLLLGVMMFCAALL